jgi:lipopolysaccharide export system permease protein
MSGFQRYLFRNVLRTLLAIVGGLALIALLTQGLAQDRLDLIIENRQSVVVYLWVSVLATPQIISLLMPIALFIATAAALNVAHRDNEVVVAQASGMSNWQVASPVLRLATLAAILHLGLNLWIQPAASRELRQTVSEASTDLASSLVREGMFMTHGEGLTTFAGRVNGTEITFLVANDSRDPKNEATFIAKTAFVSEVEGKPTLILRDGQRQTLRSNGALESLTFQQSPLELGAFVNDQKASRDGGVRPLPARTLLPRHEQLLRRQERRGLPGGRTCADGGAAVECGDGDAGHLCGARRRLQPARICQAYCDGVRGGAAAASVGVPDHGSRG